MVTASPRADGRDAVALAIEGFRRWVLATKDAQSLYERFGFIPLHRPERWMERPDPNMQESPDYWKTLSRAKKLQRLSLEPKTRTAGIDHYRRLGLFGTQGGNAIALAATPYYDELCDHYPKHYWRLRALVWAYPR